MTCVTPLEVPHTHRVAARLEALLHDEVIIKHDVEREGEVRQECNLVPLQWLGKSRSSKIGIEPVRSTPVLLLSPIRVLARSASLC